MGARDATVQVIDVGLEADGARLFDAPGDVGVSGDTQIGDTRMGDTALGDGSIDGSVHVDAATLLDARARCLPVRRYLYTLPSDVALSCASAPPAVVFRATVPDVGRAVAFARLRVRHRDGGAAVHFWAASLAVGAPIASYAVGDDVCPGYTAERSTMGYGRLNPTQSEVLLYTHQGSSPCVDGTLSVLAGSTIEVLVEDAACEGEYLQYGSYYATSGTSEFFDWSPVMMPHPGAQGTITTTRANEHVRVIGVVEGTPHANPNTLCGSENPNATLVMQTELDGTIVSTNVNVIPASMGMGHLVLATDPSMDRHLVTNAGTHTARMLVGSNTSSRVTTGGCCGDAALAVIRVD